MCKERGFTLIELLVVVLIIGILSSVALPQYQKAVEKSRAAEVMQNWPVIEREANLFLLANPGDTAALQDFAEGVLQGGHFVDRNTYKTKNFEYYCEIQEGTGFHCEIDRVGNWTTACSNDSLYTFYLNNFGPDGAYRNCVECTEIGKSICAGMKGVGFSVTDVY